MVTIKEIAELSQIISRNRIKKIDMLSGYGPTDNEYFVIYDALAKGKFSNETEIATVIGLNSKSNSYHVFKYRLWEKLLNNLLFLNLDEREFRAYRKAIADCNRNQYCIRLLLILNARQAAVSLAEKTIKTALKFELANTVLFCARYLRTHASLLGDSKQFEIYDEIVEQYHKVLYAEDIAAKYLEKINLDEAIFNFSKCEPTTLSKDYLQLVSSLYEEFPTYQIGLYYYRIQGINAFMNRNYHDALESWSDFEKFIDKYEHFEHQVRTAEAELNKMDCYLHLHDFAGGLSCAQKGSTLFKAYSYNWHLFNEYYVILAFHTKNYVHAYKTVVSVIEAGKFNGLPGNHQEIWNIFAAYLFILEKAGKVTALDSKIITNFKLNKFLNSITLLSKDKRGHNVGILVIQLLFLFIERDYPAIIGKIDALTRYTTRYFSDDKSKREFLFLRMVIETERSGFKLNKSLGRVQPYYDDLKASQYSYSKDSGHLEIIPFLDLWDIICENLIND